KQSRNATNPVLFNHSSGGFGPGLARPCFHFHTALTFQPPGPPYARPILICVHLRQESLGCPMTAISQPSPTLTSSHGVARTLYHRTCTTPQKHQWRINWSKPMRRRNKNSKN